MNGIPFAFTVLLGASITAPAIAQSPSQLYPASKQARLVTPAPTSSPTGFTPVSKGAAPAPNPTAVPFRPASKGGASNPTPDFGAPVSKPAPAAGGKLVRPSSKGASSAPTPTGPTLKPASKATTPAPTASGPELLPAAKPGPDPTKPSLGPVTKRPTPASGPAFRPASKQSTATPGFGAMDVPTKFASPSIDPGPCGLPGPGVESLPAPKRSFGAPSPELDVQGHDLELEFRLVEDASDWSSSILLPRVPAKLKAVTFEVEVQGHWALRSESLAPVFDPPTTTVHLHGQSSVRLLDHDATSFGLVEQTMHTRFDGSMDWNGDSGATTVAADPGSPLEFEIPPQAFEGTGYLRVPVVGSQSTHHHVVSGSRDTDVETNVTTEVRVRVRYVFQ